MRRDRAPAVAQAARPWAAAAGAVAHLAASTVVEHAYPEHDALELGQRIDPHRPLNHATARRGDGQRGDRCGHAVWQHRAQLEDGELVGGSYPAPKRRDGVEVETRCCVRPGTAPATALLAGLTPCAQGSLAPKRTAASVAEQISKCGAGRPEPAEVERTEWETVEHGKLAQLHSDFRSRGVLAKSCMLAIAESA